MQVNLCEKEDCIGCFACQQACKKEAIKTVYSSDGFAYPEIDEETCVRCGACMKVCPIISTEPPYHYNQDSPCYSAYQKDSDIRMGSSSGGMFYTLAKQVIDSGGIVYGAAWTDNMQLKHQKAEDEVTLKKLMRSKYVQSDTSEVYADLRNELSSNRKVLFSGTPCQVAALHSFLHGKDYPQLLTVDVVCQGVPSPGIFKNYIKFAEAKYGAKVVDAVFRTKENGWRCGLLLLLLLADGRKVELKYSKNDFYHAFLKNYILRESCYHCQFKSHKKGCYSDITLADFWRIGTTVPFECSTYEKGISAILTNTGKGAKAFEEVKDHIIWEERTYQEFSTNGGLRVAQRPPKQKEAAQEAMTVGMDTIQSKYFPYTRRMQLSDFLNMHLSQRKIQNIKKWLKRK